MMFDDLENCTCFMYYVILAFCCLFVLHYISVFCLVDIECVRTGEVFMKHS